MIADPLLLTREAESDEDEARAGRANSFTDRSALIVTKVTVLRAGDAQSGIALRELSAGSGCRALGATEHVYRIPACSGIGAQPLEQIDAGNPFGDRRAQQPRRDDDADRVGDDEIGRIDSIAICMVGVRQVGHLGA